MAMLPAGQCSLSPAASHDEADMIARGVLAVPSAGAQHRRIDAPSAPRLRPAADPVLLPDFLALEASAWPFALEENPTLDPAAEGMWCDDFPMFEELEIAPEHVLWSAVEAPPALPSLGAPSGDVSGKFAASAARGGARAPTARSSGGVAPAPGVGAGKPPSMTP
eukprot:CAMPEP_0177384744 /NCGR_PEP_ID=MMETSP0368-20130122/49873_1 /TAXON_ID=447022 ORGANISM="Scrippsiella hangoei-like, Strain SHHI-4" /NCGR_SAMPLE_ID=MMETSP0368 /ASSEMBLY_ACC=CAM_ASM_000363 /LENGTH=164 /DNA_ID=CAMNT_0018849465 /DNA_START=65 /DNA_END=555 /DNA_ORIENTATION=+